MTRIRPANHRTAIGALILALAVAAILRVWGINFGLPNVLAHPDESRVAHTAVGFLSGALHPGFFNYPTLFMYVTGALDAVYCVSRVAVGSFPSLEACAASWPTDWEPFFLIPRVLSAAAGVATVAILFVLLRRLVDEAAGVAGAMLLAVSFLHARDSHFGVTDISMTFLLVASVALLLRAHDGRALHGFARAGLVGGLAASTKYNAALLVIPAMISTVAALVAGDRGALMRLPVFGAAMAAGFVAGTPYAVLDPMRFWTDASAEATHLGAGHGISLGRGWVYHATTTLRHGVTLPVLAGAVGGLVFIFRARPWRAAIVFAFPVAYYVVAGRGQTVFARYMVPMVPFTCAAAGILIGAAARRIRLGAAGEGQTVIAAVALALAVGGLSLWKIVQFDRVINRTDSRVLAAEWLLQRGRAGESVYLSGSHYGRPDVFVRGRPGPLTIVTFDAEAQAFRDTAGREVPSPQWIVVQESPLLLYSHVPEAVTALLRDYDLLHSVRAVNMRQPHVYDQQDAWFVPLAGFEGVVRPGPNLSIYHRQAHRR
jgi:4-amino-4-deoxy-L-arabinose transferase-like glycosyltransferase